MDILNPPSPTYNAEEGWTGTLNNVVEGSTGLISFVSGGRGF